MTDSSAYTPPKIWTWNKENGGRFANINRPIAGPTQDKELPVGRHPMQLYSLATPNGVKVTVMLEELLALGHAGAEYDAWLIRINEGDQFGSGFVGVNPNSKIPALMDYSGDKPVRVFESGAILLYLAEKTGKLLPADMAAKYEAIQWMMVQMTTVGPMFGQHVHFTRFAPAGNDYSKSRYATQVHRVFEVIDQRLAASPYLGGAEYGLADIATYPWARNIPVLLGADAAAKFPTVMRWVGVINERPAVKKALAQVDDIRARTTQFDKAQPQDLDKLFGRGTFAAA